MNATWKSIVSKKVIATIKNFLPAENCFFLFMNDDQARIKTSHTKRVTAVLMVAGFICTNFLRK